MTLEILQVPGCPGADLLAARLDGLLAGRRGVTRRVVASQAEAERLGMTGSPTLLADGADPFARPGLLPAVSCRLYRDEHGQPGPAPSTASSAPPRPALLFDGGVAVREAAITKSVREKMKILIYLNIYKLNFVH